MTNHNTEEPLEGPLYLTLVRDQETKCHTATVRALAEFGRNLPSLESRLGTVLSLLERAACCWWGCAGADHAVESLIGRVYGFACGSHRLMQAGRYDESLLLVRALGELSNLLVLFAADDSAFVNWRSANEESRCRDYLPVKVRLSLEKGNIPIPMDESRYKRLCSLTAHPNPSVKPGMHNPSGLAVLGGHVQIGGAVVVLNELAHVLGCATISAASLLQLPLEVKLRIGAEGSRLQSTVGPINSENISRVLSEYRNVYRV